MTEEHFRCDASLQPACWCGVHDAFRTDDHCRMHRFASTAPALLLRVTARARQRPALALIRRDLHPHDASTAAAVGVPAHCHVARAGRQLRIWRRVCNGRRDRRLLQNKHSQVRWSHSTYESKFDGMPIGCRRFTKALRLTQRQLWQTQTACRATHSSNEYVQTHKAPWSFLMGRALRMLL